MKSALTMIFVLALSACSHRPKVHEIPATANVDSEIQSLDGEINSAVANQENVLAPYNFTKAQAALKDAKEAQGKGKKSEDVLKKVAVGKAYIQRTHEIADTGHKNIGEVINVRKRAIEAGAPTYFSKEFERADRKMIALGRELEKNDVDDAVKRSSRVQDDYLELELMAIKQTSLSHAKDLVELGVKEDGKKYAPNSYAQAQKKIKDTEDFIVANRSSQQEIARKSSEAEGAAELFLKITKDAKHNKKVSAEDLALEMDQNKRILSKKDSELSRKDSELAEGREAETRLANEKFALESLEEQYQSAQEVFTDKEAEVYKQGDKLVIRLKGLSFPAAKSDLKGSSLPLLQKVEDVIKQFPESFVMVEGFTDSDGSKEANQKLSTERANVIKDYLVSTEAVSENDISAVGLGDQKPLASNKTAQGKAQNRRVDVIITPTKQEVEL